MNQDYELKFYEIADRCFEYLDEKYPGMWFVPHAKAAINYLWSNEDLVIEDVPIEHEIVQVRMMERLNFNKLEEYLKEKEERGWFLKKELNAIDLYWVLMTVDEYGEIFEDDRYYDVILDD